MIFFRLLLPSLFLLNANGQEDEPKQACECSRYAYDYHIIESQINMKNEIARLSERLAAIEQKVKQPTIATHVRLSQTTPLTGNQRVMYDVLVTNEGDGYDVESGQFTTYVPGLYLIHVTACMLRSWVDLNIVKDFTVFGRVFAGDGVYHNCGSEAITVRLREREKVWVERIEGSGTTLNQDHGWNSFTVTLLSAD
jgi:hypothetical protein